MKSISVLCSRLDLFTFSLLILSVGFSQAETSNENAAPLLANVQGGLVVQLGTGDTALPAALGRTGRYIINVLDRDADRVDKARATLREDGVYGLVSAEQIPEAGKLPYAENLVNAIIIQDFTVSAVELRRALTPLGVVLVMNPELLKRQQLAAAGFEVVANTESDGRAAITVRKPWPKGMGTWSHPRHGADGNAVSDDTLVGPPRRVRWMAAATHEVEGMVTAGGRNFYGGVLARDSFNGLRLWHHDLRKGEHNRSSFRLPRISRRLARPIASEGHIYAVVKDKLVALDAATGKIAIEFPGLIRPRQIAHHGEFLVASNVDSVRAYEAQTGKELWAFKAGDAKQVVVGFGIVSLIQGRANRGEKLEAIGLDLATGTVKWRHSDFEWLPRVTRTVLHKAHLAFEISSLNDHDKNNELHIVSAQTGKPIWDKAYPPGMNHNRQARAMYLDNKLWILHGGKTNTADRPKLKRLPVQISALNPTTGKTLVTHKAGLAHCFPPVATPNYMFAGTMDLTDLKSGDVIANRITKANCSRENGWVPANGLVYTTPKHCTCWPMLRGYVSMAPSKSGDTDQSRPTEELKFRLEKGTGKVDAAAANPKPSDWPLYRHDRWRSSSSMSPGPEKLNAVWSVQLASKEESAIFGSEPGGPILHDWRENPVVKGPLSAPVIANGSVFVTRPNAHEVLAVHADTGKVRWRFTANGRVDTPPAIHRGLCLFGSAAGSVYALRADTGEMVWRLQAAPSNERIVVYGQVESPWPVPGAVLIIDNKAYFAAGRQPLADGGILVFAIDPLTGQRHWVHRINSIPQRGDYENSGLEFDPFDILHQEGGNIAMSRWLISRDGKKMAVDKWNAFARVNTGNGSVYVPRGSWTYGARHQHRFPGEASRRPLIVFRDSRVFSSLNGTTEIFRRDFNLEKDEKFQSRWITGWSASGTARKGGKPYRTYRLAEKAAWTTDGFTPKDPNAKPKPFGTQLFNEFHAMVLSADDRLFVVHKDGRLKSISTKDGQTVAETRVPIPAWDGLALAGKRLFLTTQSGELICLGDPASDEKL